ncbi:MAG: hypothetical protein GC134_09560 [Proteobacteria bacterium]|nr:hypothetical protein [Pseudomonadota bacterium]
MNRVKLLKILLGAGALALTAALFALSGPGRQMVDMADKPAESVQASGNVARPGLQDVASTVMTNPRFFGEDNNDRRWEVKASRAEQTTVDGTPAFRLVAVSAVAELAKNRPLAFEAGQGQYLPDAKKVALSDGVIVSGYDYVVRTEAIRYDLATGSGTGEGGVQVSGPRGDLSAPKFDMEKNGRILHLYGGVKARIYPKGDR